MILTVVPGYRHPRIEGPFYETPKLNMNPGP